MFLDWILRMTGEFLASCPKPQRSAWLRQIFRLILWWSGTPSPIRPWRLDYWLVLSRMSADFQFSDSPRYFSRSSLSREQTGWSMVPSGWIAGLGQRQLLSTYLAALLGQARSSRVSAGLGNWPKVEWLWLNCTSTDLAEKLYADTFYSVLRSLSLVLHRIRHATGSKIDFYPTILDFQ